MGTRLPRVRHQGRLMCFAARCHMLLLRGLFWADPLVCSLNPIRVLSRSPLIFHERSKLHCRLSPFCLMIRWEELADGGLGAYLAFLSQKRRKRGRSFASQRFPLLFPAEEVFLNKYPRVLVLCRVRAHTQAYPHTHRRARAHTHTHTAAG